MATPPPEFVDTWDVPNPARSILEPTTQAEPGPVPRVVLGGPPAEPTDDHPEPRRHDQADLVPAIRDEVASPAVPPPGHRPPEPEAILDSLVPWMARLADRSWRVRTDQFWALTAGFLLVTLVVVAIQRGPVFPSSTSVESGAPGSGFEDPAGPEADDAELPLAARSSERLGEPTDDSSDGVVSEPATGASGSSKAKIFTRTSRKKSTATAVSGAESGDDPDVLDFDADDGPGVEDSSDGIPKVGGSSGASTTVADDDDTAGPTDAADDGFTSSTSRRSTILAPSRSSMTRLTVNTTTSTAQRSITTYRTITTRTSSTTSPGSTTASSTTRSTTTTSPTTTTTRSSSSTSTASTTTTTASTSSTSDSTIASSTTTEPEEPDPDPEPGSVFTEPSRRPIE